MALLITELFEAWIRDSWEVHNRPPYRAALPYLNDSDSENSIPENQQINPLRDDPAHFWTFPSPNKRFLNISKTTPFRDGSALFWMFRSLNTPFQCNNKWTSLLDSTAHTWTFRTLKKRILSIKNRLLISERFEAWKRDSWEEANRPPYKTALPILERFAAWKRYSWASANQPPWGTALPISEHFAASIRDSWASAS